MTFQQMEKEVRETRTRGARSGMTFRHMVKGVRLTAGLKTTVLGGGGEE